MDTLQLTNRGKPVLVNLHLVAYLQPDEDGTLVMFSTGLTLEVSESYDKAIATLITRRGSRSS